MLNAFVSSLLQRVAGTSDAAVLEAVFECRTAVAKIIMLLLGVAGYQRRCFCPRGAKLSEMICDSQLVQKT